MLKTPGLLLLLALGGTSPNPQTVVDPAQEIVFPQVANGVTSTLGLFTNMALTNPSDTPIRVDLSFWTPDGLPMMLTLLDTITRQVLTPVQSATNLFSFTIRAFETRYIETDGLGRISVGWANAAVQSGAVVGGVAAYHFYDPATGATSSIVSVGASAASGAFFTPVVRDVSSGVKVNTAVAIANSSARTVYFRVILIGNLDSGSPSYDVVLSLGPAEQRARFVNEVFSNIGPTFFGTAYFFQSDSEGNVVVGSDLHAVALLESRGILTIYSSLPVTNVFPD